MIRTRIDGHLFTVADAEIVDGVIRPRRLTYEWVSGESGSRRCRSVEVVERRDGWYAQIVAGFSASAGVSAWHGANPAPQESVRVACAVHGLAWPPKAGKP